MATGFKFLNSSPGKSTGDRCFDDLGFRVQAFGFRACAFGVQGVGSMVQGLIDALQNLSLVLLSETDRSPQARIPRP